MHKIKDYTINAQLKTIQFAHKLKKTTQFMHKLKKKPPHSRTEYDTSDSGQKYSDTSNIPYITSDSGQKYSDTSNIPYIFHKIVKNLFFSLFLSDFNNFYNNKNRI